MRGSTIPHDFDFAPESCCDFAISTFGIKAVWCSLTTTCILLYRHAGQMTG